MHCKTLDVTFNLLSLKPPRVNGVTSSAWGYALQRSLNERLTDLIEERWGGVDSSAVRELADEAGVAYSTLARLLLYEGKQATRSPRRRTINSVARALDVNPNWLADGKGSRQLGLWPVILDDDDVEDVQAPVDELASALQELQGLPAEIQLRACRAALASILNVVVTRGGRVTGTLYNHLIRLDIQHRGTGDQISVG